MKRGTWWSAAVLAWLVLGAPPASAQKDAWERYMTAGAESYEAGEYGAAEVQYGAAVKAAEKAGRAGGDLAISLNNLALVMHRKGDFDEAERLYERSLAVTESALGADHPQVASTLTNIAWVAIDRGDHRQAEELLLRALAIRKAALGPAHPTVAASLTELAAVYTAEGDYAKAEQMLKAAVIIREEALGPDDPNLGQSLSNLGAVYSAQGRFDEAEALFERTLTIIEKSLGPGLPKSTAMSRVLYRLADVMHRTGRDTQAAERESRAGAIEAAAGLEPGSLRP